MIIRTGEYPPNYDAIAAAFPLKDHQPIFAYNPFIYNPGGWSIPPEILAHEDVHGRRQGEHPAEWWVRYIADDNFRLAEEILAHVAEYNVAAAQAKGRLQRRMMFAKTVSRLCAPLYGYKPPLSMERARRLLKWALRQQAKAHDSQARTENLRGRLPAIEGDGLPPADP